MGLTGNILVTLALTFWPMVWVVSVMGMGGPGASNSLSWIVQLLVFMSYPFWILLWLSLSGKDYWGLSPLYFLVGFLITFSVLNASLLGYAFNLIRGIKNEGYSVSGGTVYYNAKALEEADASTFKQIEHELAPLFASYASDQRHTYFEGKVVEGASGGVLEPLDGDWSGWYVASGNDVIFGEKLLRGCIKEQLETFEGMSAHWARCNSNIYFAGRRIRDADAESFTPIREYLAVDKNRFYSGHQALNTPADAQTFRRLGGPYYRDDSSVYVVSSHELERVNKADPGSFEVIYECIDDIQSDARDSDTRYFYGEPVASR